MQALYDPARHEPLADRAGRSRTAPAFCHGTAGNGFAFLALLERTGDERWLARARAFAMHAGECAGAAREAAAHPHG